MLPARLCVFLALAAAAVVAQTLPPIALRQRPTKERGFMCVPLLDSS
jgi:hypothetical protein